MLHPRGDAHIATALQEAEKGAAQDAERREREREAAAAAREPARRLAELLAGRGWRIGLPQVTIGLLRGGDCAAGVLLDPRTPEGDSLRRC